MTCGPPAPSQLAPSSCPSQLAPSSCPSRLHVLALNRNSVYAAVTFHLKDCNTVVTIIFRDGFTYKDCNTVVTIMFGDGGV